MASDLVAHQNPCPNPHIPPLRLEIEDIPISKNHPQYSHAVAAITAYWRQATNMALSDQKEYTDLVASLAFTVPKSAEGTPSQHKLYKAIKTRPTWARYVMFHSIYGSVRSLAEHVRLAHGSDVMGNFFDKYCKHHPWPEVLKKRRRESIAEGQPPSKKHAEVPASSVSTTSSSGQLALINTVAESKTPARDQPVKSTQQSVVAPQTSASDGNKLALPQRSKTLSLIRAVKPSLQKAAEGDKMDEILRELGRIREHQVKEAEKMERNVARLEGSIAEFITRFRVVEENVQLLLKKNP
ncbi:hypothetical protein V8C42DRAFT_346562 [Trichoderma barbatum]